MAASFAPSDMNPFEIPDYAAYILAFLTVAPYVLLLNFKALREHAGWFGRFWDRQVASRLDGISTRFFSPAVWLGFLGCLAKAARRPRTVWERTSLGYQPESRSALTTSIVGTNA